MYHFLTIFAPQIRQNALALSSNLPRKLLTKNIYPRHIHTMGENTYQQTLLFFHTGMSSDDFNFLLKIDVMNGNIPGIDSLKARLMGPTWGPSGADRWAPYWPHERCYLGLMVRFFITETEHEGDPFLLKIDVMNGNIPGIDYLKARLMGPTWGPSGADRWAPCWSHERCYLGLMVRFFITETEHEGDPKLAIAVFTDALAPPEGFMLDVSLRF